MKFEQEPIKIGFISLNSFESVFLSHLISMKTLHSLICVFVVITLGIDAVSAAPIPVESINKEADGVIFHMTPGVMKLQVCDLQTVRVLYSPSEQLPQIKSFVITHVWQPVPFEVIENAQTVTVSTGKLKVAVNRSTGAVEFFNMADKSLLKEATAGGRC